MELKNYAKYIDDKANFHYNYGSENWNVETSPMNEYNEYTKTYNYDNGAVWYERIRPITEMVEVEVKGLKFETEVKLLQIEYWNSENSNSSVYYEKY